MGGVEGLAIYADLAYESADGTPLAADVYRLVDAVADPLPLGERDALKHIGEQYLYNDLDQGPIIPHGPRTLPA